jgi:hypothetical protein
VAYDLKANADDGMRQYLRIPRRYWEQEIGKEKQWTSEERPYTREQGLIPTVEPKKKTKICEQTRCLF